MSVTALKERSRLSMIGPLKKTNKNKTVSIIYWIVQGSDVWSTASISLTRLGRIDFIQECFLDWTVPNWWTQILNYRHIYYRRILEQSISSICHVLLVIYWGFELHRHPSPADCYQPPPPTLYPYPLLQNYILMSNTLIGHSFSFEKQSNQINKKK